MDMESYGLKDKCVLVSLNIGKPKMTEKDARTSKEVAQDNGASEAAVSVIKKLYPKHLLAPIVTIEGAARRYVESVTDPVGKGLGILPCKLFMQFTDRIGNFRIQYQQAVTVFCQNYVNVLSLAQAQQGSMFNTADYPDVSEIQREFTFEVLYPTLESARRITLQMEAEALETYRTMVEEQTKQQMMSRQKRLYGKLFEAVQRIHAQCSKDKGKIYDSLMGNLSELLTVLPALNLDEDPEFENMCREASSLIVAPEAIRTVPEVRQSLAANADEILRKMQAFL